MIEDRLDKRQETFGDGDEQNQSFPLMDYLQLLWFRRKLILAITLFVGVVGYVHVNELKNVYSASSTLMVGLREEKVIPVEAVLTGAKSGGDVGDEIAVLQSRVLAEKVVRRLNLINDPEFNPSLREPEESVFDFLRYLNPRHWIPDSWKKMLKEALGRETEGAKASPSNPPPPPPATNALDREAQRQEQQIATATSILMGKISVSPMGWGNVIRITVSSLNPKTAVRLANEIPEAYMIDQLEARYEATEKANVWLTDQLVELEAQVADSERAVEIYRDEHGLAEGQGNSLLDQELSQLNSQLIIAEAEKVEVDARLAQLRRLLEAGDRGLETAPEVISSALIQTLRGQEAQALSRMSQLSVEYGPKHPRMLQVTAEVEEIRDRIRVEIERIIVGLEQEAEFAAARVNSLQVSLDFARGETSEQNKEAIQLRALQRQAAANRALYERFLNRFKETSSTQDLETSSARVLSPAQGAGLTYPNRKKMLTNYILLAFFGACGLVLALQFLNPGLLSPEQVHQVLREHVIGLIPLIPGKVVLHDQVLDKPNSSLVEAINSLKFSLELSDPDHPVKAVAVTSAVPEEGKTTLAISLARVVAASGKKVIIMDGDLRRSSVGKKLDLRNKHKGLSDLVVAGDVDLSEFILRDEKGKMDYLPPGTAKYTNATDIFSSYRMASIIDRLKSHYDLVVVDTPPVMAVADARIIGRVVDKTLFVIRWDKTPRKVARAALDQLRRADVSIAGVVLQQVDLNRYGRMGYGDSGYYYHYGRYGKYYSE
jgi:capsular exopolysaccharide synthesis family protein